MSTNRILIVDDEANIRRVLLANLKAAGYETVAASSGYEALQKISEEKFDLVLLDKNMLGMGGIETLKQIKAKDADIIVIIMTAYQSVESAIAAMKEGAYDYITKPFDMDALKNSVKNALERKQLVEENRALKAQLGQQTKTNLIAKSRAMLQILELIERVADSMSNVLIYGETGTGKEVIARAIHDKSIRRDRPFVKVNCATLPENLLESELFGHVKGAFTDAIKDRVGRLEIAEGGTLFFDEIGELSRATQVKLLRLAQERKYEQLGSSETKKADVRIISATNKDLQKAIADGEFREDLYYRLNVISIKVPPLRERKEEIPALTYHFLERHAETKEKSFAQISPEALQLLMDYSWPGNVRELENVIERAIAIGQGDALLPQHLPKELRQELPSEFPKVGATIKEMEKQLILRTLEQTSGNQTKAAQILGITRQTLINKLKEYQYIENGSL
ncbi:TPA: sigma-54-dependent Fis family transcriptional regulator [Candidatus Poribacteria bacterium]|nr:sigma-54-dependent Fis family transcriptional regulator [Candidatus Poribacteria bacterium]